MVDLKYFMWGFQQHFLRSGEFLLERMLRELGCPLEHPLFLLGFRVSGDDKFLPVCVEPDDCRYQPGLFAGIYHDALENYARPPSTTEVGGGENWHMHDDAHDEFLRRLYSGVLEVLGRNTDEAALTTYATFPWQVNNHYVVCLVLQIGRGNYEGFPIWENPFRRTSMGIRVPLSHHSCPP